MIFEFLMLAEGLYVCYV